MDREGRQTTVQGVAELDTTERLTHTLGTIQSAASFENYSFVVILFLQAKCNILL